MCQISLSISLIDFILFSLNSQLDDDATDAHAGVVPIDAAGSMRTRRSGIILVAFTLHPLLRSSPLPLCKLLIYGNVDRNRGKFEEFTDLSSQGRRRGRMMEDKKEGFERMGKNDFSTRIYVSLLLYYWCVMIITIMTMILMFFGVNVS